MGGKFTLWFDAVLENEIWMKDGKDAASRSPDKCAIFCKASQQADVDFCMSTRSAPNGSGN